jgi:hypothetical protein
MKDQLRAFIGQDIAGDACLYVRNETKGAYLTTAQLRKVLIKLRKEIGDDTE